MSNHDVVIVGGGPAGLAAGLYTSRMNLKTLLLDRGPLGGQLLNTELVEDYPGYESILGTELATKMGDHARKFGLEVREFEPVKEIDKEGTTKVIRLESGDEIRTPERGPEYAAQLVQKINELKLNPERIAPVHGKVVPYKNLLIAFNLEGAARGTK